MALTQEEIQLAQEYKSKGFSKEDFKEFLIQKRQRDFLAKNRIYTPKKRVDNGEKILQNAHKEENLQGWDTGVKTGEAISNFGKGIKFESNPDDGFLESAGKFVGNIPGNLLQIGGGLTSAASNPVGTFDGVKTAVKGVGENLLNKALNNPVAHDTLGFVADKLGTRDNFEKNYKKMQNGGYYTSKEKEFIGKGIDNFTSQIVSNPKRTLQKLAVENPADLLFLGSGTAARIASKTSKVAKAAKFAGDTAKAEKYAKISDKASKVSKITNPINIVTEPIKYTGKGVGKIGVTLTSKISGMNPNTLKTIVKNPELFRKVKKGIISREKLADKVVKSIDQRIQEVGELGAKYNIVKVWKGKIDTKKINPRKILEKYDIKSTQGGLDFSNSPIGSISNQNAILKAYEIIKTRRPTSGKDILNLRRALDDVINYKSEATDAAKKIVREMRKNIDDVAKEQIPGLSILDKRYGKEISEMNKIKKYMFNKDGLLKEDYISKVSNLLGKGKEKTLERIKKLVPEIEHEINAIKALEDVIAATGQKTGSYTQQILVGGGGFAIGGVPGLITAAIITNPSLVSNVLQASGIAVKTISRINKKILHGVKLTREESNIVKRTIKNQIIKNKSSSPIILDKNKYKTLTSSDNLSYPIISQTNAREIVRKYFTTDEVGVEFLENIQTSKGLQALGRYKNKMISFAKNPTENVPEHEVFHAYFDLALGDKQKLSTLNLIKKEKGFKTNLDAEEFLADSFADFAINRRVPKGISQTLKQTIGDLWFKFKKIFGKEDKIESLFRNLEDIGKGKKKFNTINKGSNEEKYFNMGDKESYHVSSNKINELNDASKLNGKIKKGEEYIYKPFEEQKLKFKDKNHIYFNRKTDYKGTPQFVSTNTYYIGKATIKKNDFSLSDLVKRNSAGYDFDAGYRANPNAVRFSYKEGIKDSYYDREVNRIFLPKKGNNVNVNTNDINLGIYDYYKQKYGGLTIDDYKNLPDIKKPKKKIDGKELFLKYLKEAQKNSDEAKDFSSGYYLAWKRELEQIRNSGWEGKQMENTFKNLQNNINKVDKYYDKKGVNIERAIGHANKYGVRPIISLDNGTPVIYFETPKGQVSFHIPQYTDFRYVENISELKKMLPAKILKNVELIDGYKWSGERNSAEIINNLTPEDFL